MVKMLRDVIIRTLRLARRGTKPYINYLLSFHELGSLPTKPKSMPSVIYLEPIRACNLRCPMCLRQWRRMKDGLMKLEDFAYIVNTIHEYALGISFAGWGEWFLHKDFPSMLKMLDERNMPCDFITNATLLNVSALDFILKPGNLIVKIGISMDSPTTGSIRNYLDLNKVIENIKHLSIIKRSRHLILPLIRFRVTLMKINAGEITDIIRIAKSIGIDRIDIIPVMAWNSKHYNSPYGPLSLQDLTKIQRQVLKMSQNVGVGVRFPLPSSTKSNSVCTVPWRSIFISWNGDVHPCCFYLDKALGNIFEESLQRIWRGKKYSDFRLELLKGEDKFCNNCMKGEFHRNEIGV